MCNCQRLIFFAEVRNVKLSNKIHSVPVYPEKKLSRWSIAKKYEKEG